MMGECWGTDGEPRRTSFRTPYWPRAGFEQMGAIEASREPSPGLYSEAMMIRPVSRNGIHGPDFRCHGSPMRSSRVIISCPYDGRATLLEITSHRDGAVGLQFPPWSPASPG